MSNYKLIDSHVNFGHELLANKSKEIIKESVENEIIGMLCVNSNLSEFSKDLSIVIDYETIDITIGQHPNYVDEIPINDIKKVLYFHNDPLSMNGSKTVTERYELLKLCNKIVFNSEWSKSRFLTSLEEIYIKSQKLIVIHQIKNKKKIYFKKKRKNNNFCWKIKSS